MDKVTVTLEVEVDPDWIDFCTSSYQDIFIYGYCGYWMQGLEHDDELGWLVRQSDDDRPAIMVAKDAGYSKIVEAWKTGQDLPEGWHRLNKDAAIKAYAAGIKRYGLDWYENGDANTYDFAIQMALLGEIVYG